MTTAATTTIDALTAQLWQMTIPANMMDCSRCEASGTYGTHGKCYSCKGSRRVLVPAVAKIARKVRTQLGAARKAASLDKRHANDTVLAEYKVTMDHVRYVMHNGVAEAWECANRYAEGIPFTAGDRALFVEMNRPI